MLLMKPQCVWQNNILKERCRHPIAKREKNRRRKKEKNRKAQIWLGGLPKSSQNTAQKAASPNTQTETQNPPEASPPKRKLNATQNASSKRKQPFQLPGPLKRSAFPCAPLPAALPSPLRNARFETQVSKRGTQRALQRAFRATKVGGSHLLSCLKRTTQNARFETQLKTYVKTPCAKSAKTPKRASKTQNAKTRPERRKRQNVTPTAPKTQKRHVGHDERRRRRKLKTHVLKTRVSKTRPETPKRKRKTPKRTI